MPTLEKDEFYTNSNGDMVFTEIYHQRRGFCCKSGCRHCPFGFGQSIDPEVPTELLLSARSQIKEDCDEQLAELAQELMDRHEIT